MATANSTAAPRRRAAKPAAPPKPSFDFDLKPWVPVLSDRERRTVERAFRMLEKHAVYRTESANSPMLVRDLLKLRMCHLEHEVFAAMWLDAQNNLIAYDDLFRGSLTQTSVYPREVVKQALAHNAAAVIFAHNHPSGTREPSQADIQLTRQLKETLALVDVRVLDHFIVAGGVLPLSMAELGQV